jgi:hypothetical protein
MKVAELVGDNNSKVILYGSREDLLKEIARLNEMVKAYKNQCKLLEFLLSSQITILKLVFIMMQL